MLMNQLIAFELDDSDSRDLDYPSGGWHTRQKPVYLRGMGKVHDEFIHDAACTDCAANGSEPKIGRIHTYEMILVKALELIVLRETKSRGLFEDSAELHCAEVRCLRSGCE